MGVYIFKSKHGPYIKVGHVKAGDPWMRVYNRGFYSCICPNSLKGKVNMEDLELCKWYPSLNTSDEKYFHFKMKEYHVCGEWYNEKYLDAFVGYFDELIASKNDFAKPKDETMYSAVIYIKVPYKNKNILLESLPTDNFLTDIGGNKLIFEQKSDKISSGIKLPSLEEAQKESETPNKGKKWSSEEKSFIKKEIFKNSSQDDIAKKLGRTPYGVHCQLRYMIINYIEKTNINDAKRIYDPSKYKMLDKVWSDIYENYEIETHD
jgi:hypothetical protein